jgi:hypothetical protein
LSIAGKEGVWWLGRGRTKLYILSFANEPRIDKQPGDRSNSALGEEVNPLSIRDSAFLRQLVEEIFIYPAKPHYVVETTVPVKPRIRPIG